MFAFRFVTAWGNGIAAWSTIQALVRFDSAAGPRLLAGSAASGQLHLLALAPDGGLTTLDSKRLIDSRGGAMLADAALASLDTGTFLYTASRTGGWRTSGAGSSWMDLRQLGGDRLSSLAPLQRAGEPAPVSAMEVLTLGEETWLAAAIGHAGRPGGTLELLDLQPDGGARPVARAEDGAKLALDGVTDMATVDRGDHLLLAAASARKDGISLFRVDPGGGMTLADTLTAKDGLWVSGVDALAAARVAGVDYLIAGSAAAGSLSVIRVNQLGVMFVTDHLLDSRETRFDNVSHIAAGHHRGRVLVVAGGGDGGLSLLELLPDGQLFHHQALEARDGWAALAGGISGLSVALSGAEGGASPALDIIAAAPGGLVRLSVPLAALGPPIRGGAGAEGLTGGTGDDLVFGGGGHDTLSGGAGDDLLVAGPDGAVMTGGAGADIFRLSDGTAQSRITDFEQGLDRIDLSDWGRIYDISALTISARNFGALITYGDHSLRVAQSGGGTIPTSAWGTDDFLF